ncbi:MAG: Gfo/Idh/MocA family oxidoreductase [Anaerolineae bacterium]
MDKIKLGIIGCGDIAFRSYLPALRKLGDRVELLATCDLDLARAGQARQEYGAQASFARADELLAMSDLDGVVILTPMRTHGALSIAALEAGLHVYVEKVMAITLDEADRMVELAEQNGLILACAPSTILASAYQRVKELIQAGEIGRVCFMHALGAHGGPARWDDYTSDPTWFYQEGGGPLFDLAVYPVQILTQLFGPVRRVTAFSGLAVPEVVMTARKVRGQTLKVQVDDTTPMILDFGDAIFASIDASYNMLSSRLPAMQIWGSEGALTAPQFLGDEVGMWRRGDAEWHITHLPPSLYDELGLASGLLHWLDCIREGKQPINNGRHARHVLDVLLSAQESARTGLAQVLTTHFDWPGKSD